MQAKQLFLWMVHTVRRAGWAPLGVFFLHVIASRGFDAYTRFPPLDIPMHFLGGVVIAYFFYHAATAAPRYGLSQPTDRLTQGVLIFALTCTATVFWEFAEFSSDYFFGTHAQVSLNDTLKDMFLGIVGGLTLLAAVWCFTPRLDSDPAAGPRHS